MRLPGMGRILIGMLAIASIGGSGWLASRSLAFLAESRKYAHFASQEPQSPPLIKWQAGAPVDPTWRTRYRARGIQRAVYFADLSLIYAEAASNPWKPLPPLPSQPTDSWRAG